MVLESPTLISYIGGGLILLFGVVLPLIIAVVRNKPQTAHHS